LNAKNAAHLLTLFIADVHVTLHFTGQLIDVIKRGFQQDK
jgi:hypothetical protein